MNVKERILSIRMINKAEKNPKLAAEIGLKTKIKCLIKYPDQGINHCRL